MPTWLKIVLLAFAVMLALATSGALLLWSYVKRHQSEWQETSVSVSNEGEAFGRGKKLDACVAESLTRLDRCGPMAVTCEANVRMFLQHCTLTADMPADFCKRVPAQSEIVRSALWAQRECSDYEAKDVQRCARVINALQDYCGER
jgi:hypothetical protein